jgi:hypothetical protein
MEREGKTDGKRQGTWWAKTGKIRNEKEREGKRGTETESKVNRKKKKTERERKGKTCKERGREGKRREDIWK